MTQLLLRKKLLKILMIYMYPMIWSNPQDVPDHFTLKYRKTRSALMKRDIKKTVHIMNCLAPLTLHLRRLGPLTLHLRR